MDAGILSDQKRTEPKKKYMKRVECAEGTMAYRSATWSAFHEHNFHSPWIAKSQFFPLAVIHKKGWYETPNIKYE